MPIKLPKVRDAEVKGKRVLLRVDFNVLFSDGKVEDLYRIERTIPTIEYLSQIAERLKVMKDGDAVMLENIRLQAGEEQNDKNFARQLAELGDIYVNEAFSVSHRKHASIVGITEFLPSYAGFLFEEE